MRVHKVIFGDIQIMPIVDRWYLVSEPVGVEIRTDEGVLRVVVDEGFRFDGRSGGKLVDWLIPNLGTQAETCCWLVHDVLAHDYDVSYETTNDLLRQMLRSIGGYGRARAWMVWRAVSLSRAWFGCRTEEERRNRLKASVRWDSK